MGVVNLHAEGLPMTRFLWLRLVRRWLSSPRPPRRRRTTRPALQVLEARWLPSNVTITVNDSHDMLDNPATVTVEIGRAHV